MVRWTSVPRGHKFDSTLQVSLSSGEEETQIQVVQRYPAGLRAILHFLPGAWGGALGAGVAASLGVGNFEVVGVFLGALALGVGIGHSIWQAIARHSQREIERVAAELVAAANEMTES